MSVMLTACRHSKQKSIARALKKRAEKQKLKKEAELQQLEADADVENFVKLWSFMIQGEEYTVMLYLACDKDTVDIFCNEEEVRDVMTSCTQEGATFEFVIGASYKARICCNGNPFDGLVHLLTVNGYPVPESK